MLGLTIEVSKPGGPAELRTAQRELPQPPAREVRVRHAAIGLNYIDVYYRSGLYSPPQWPFVPGLEGAGVVTALGLQVHEFEVGQRVAYASRPMGAYATERCIPVSRLVRLPDDLEESVAAAVLFKGLTAEYLLRRMVALQPGAWVLVHAAAGGVGSLLVQWGKHLGLRVIGTVSSESKAEAARADGAEDVVLVPREDFVERVRKLTGGAGCSAVYDGVGQDTFLRSIECVGARGLLATFGQSSGPIAPVDVRLFSNNSIFVSRPSLFHYTADAAEYQRAATEVLDLARAGVLRCRIGQTYPLAQAARAHTDLEARRTSGSTLLIP